MNIGHNQTASVPDQIALFPLSGVVLMPFAHIPLNVFEDRYINMVNDSFANGHFIEIVHPQIDAKDPVPEDAKLYQIGTLARIFSFFDPGEGAYQITLQGVMRFQITDTATSPRGYRTATVDYGPYVDDLAQSTEENGPERVQLVELMHNYLNSREIDVDWEAVDGASYAALVSSLIMTCPFSSSEKQALLEITDDTECARMLIQLFHMSLSGETGNAVKH